MLYKEIESQDESPKQLIAFQGINNISPEVLDKINSIFSLNAKNPLSNGSTLEKEKNLNIIRAFNKGKDNINRHKIPSGIISNCIFHIVKSLNSDDIERIIDNLFNRMDFCEKENYRYTKDYLIPKLGLKEKEAEKELKKKETLFKRFEEAKINEAEDFKKIFKRKQFS